MTKLWYGSLLLIMTLALAACGNDDDDDSGSNDDDATYDLHFSGEGYEPHNGEVLGVVVVNSGTGAVVLTETSHVEDGEFHFTFTDALDSGESYFIDFYGDHSLNESCTPPPEDHVWRVPFGPVREDMMIHEVHNLNFEPDGCRYF